MLSTEPMLYFGKLPSRGDFVRSAHSPALISTLDLWLSGGIEALATDPRWKEVYDEARPAHFAVLGSRSTAGLVGHLVASRDASGRRFPFITAARVQTPDALDFLAHSPLALGRAWASLGLAAGRAMDAGDATPVLAELGFAGVEVEDALQGYGASLRSFLEMQTVGSLGAMLAQSGHALDLRQLMLGLGLLLQPLPASGPRSLDRGLLLPLPGDPLYHQAVATLWLDLVAGFLTRADFEVVMFLPQAHRTPPVLVMGFDGASPRALQALLDPALGRDVYIDTRDAAWVEEHLGHDFAVHKLSSYLAQGALSLRQAVSTFKEVFLRS
jgi:type VI secretion system protein ImpM